MLSIDSESYKRAEALLKEQGVAAERVEGFDGRKPEQVQEALKLLSSHANAESLHATVSNAMLCLHTPLFESLKEKSASQRRSMSLRCFSMGSSFSDPFLHVLRGLTSLASLLCLPRSVTGCRRCECCRC